MSFLGGILDKQDPSERVRLALTRDLELRRKNERTAAQFSSYAYQGSADLILRHGRFWSGRVLPEQYEHLQGAMSACYWNALEAAEADPSLTYVEGVYTTGFGHPSSHAWCIAPDGGVLELTLPTQEERLRRAVNEMKLPFLPPGHWGYYGVTFVTSFARAMASEYGFPMFDRSTHELERSRVKYNDPEPQLVCKSREAWLAEEYAEHDFPVLKVSYDPNRTELP